MTIHDFNRPFQRYFRTRRMRLFEQLFRPANDTRIVDVGGYEMNWTFIDAKPQVLLVNLENEEWQRGRFRKTQGNGCALAFDDNSFDIAYSNSVIEHVGDAAAQSAFAQEIRRVAPRYYVQTPNKRFLIETHLQTVGLHFLPPRIARHFVRRFSVWGMLQRPTPTEIEAMLASIRLLTRKDVERLFPDAEIMEEKVAGLTKSFVAIKR